MVQPSDHHILEARGQIQSLATSEIRKVANMAMGRSDVLPFWFGESDQTTPGYIRDAASSSIAHGETFYTQNLGRPYLRQAIADYLMRLHGRSFEVDQVAVTGSGVSGLMLAAQMIVGPGDKLVAVTPVWPNVVEIPKILSATVERVSLEIKDGRWSLDVEKLLAALTPDTGYAPSAVGRVAAYPWRRGATRRRCHVCLLQNPGTFRFALARDTAG